MLRWIALPLPAFLFSLSPLACNSDPSAGGGTETDASSGTDPVTGDPTTLPTTSTTADTSAGPESSSSGPDGTESETDTEGDPDVAFPGPTKGGPIATSPDGTRLVVANRGTGELTFFALPDLTEEARLDVGSEPESVAFSPTGEEVYVVLRGSGEVARVVDVGTDPHVDGTVVVGAEPGRAALSATGRSLWVPLWTEGYVVRVDTESMTIEAEIETGGSPYAVCITNDLDLDPLDETVFVTDFYGIAIEGAREATDGARRGRVFTIDAAENLLGDELFLEPLAASGTAG